MGLWTPLDAWMTKSRSRWVEAVPHVELTLLIFKGFRVELDGITTIVQVGFYPRYYVLC
jgi:uncharacterized membrane protein SirB2